MKLYTYWRSTSSYRLRIALALKNIEVDQAFVNLVRGEQKAESYRALNPQARVPTLVLDNGTVLTQSPAIIEYLEEAFPKPALLPFDPVQRAKVRAAAAIIGCDIHPLHNVGPLNYLRQTFGRSEPDVASWIAMWIRQGLDAFETMIGNDAIVSGTNRGSPISTSSRSFTPRGGSRCRSSGIGGFAAWRTTQPHIRHSRWRILQTNPMPPSNGRAASACSQRRATTDTGNELLKLAQFLRSYSRDRQ
jgi:maleylacetoacetate isomerase/maleylpyruvate isomerase